MNKQPTTLLQGKPWIPSDMTDVQATWKAHGWKPRSETVARHAPVKRETADKTGGKQ